MNSKINRKFEVPECLVLVLKGFCMGTADIIPGVSGGTLAFILGIYERWIFSIRSFNLQFLQLILTFKFKEAFSKVEWQFLGSICFGIGLAILCFSRVLSWLLFNKPALIYSFFFGLILATVFIIGKILKKWSVFNILLIGGAAVATYFLVAMVPVNTPNSLWFIFLIGAIAISAMILPGISGAFILVLLGKYHFILESINQRNLLVLVAFGSGIVFGVIVFVRVLGWLFDKYHDLTIAILTGIIIGSLNKIWPWKETIRSIEGSHGKMIPIEQLNVLPSVINGELVGAIVLMVLGLVTALYLNRDMKTGIVLNNR